MFDSVLRVVPDGQTYAKPPFGLELEGARSQRSTLGRIDDAVQRMVAASSKALCAVADYDEQKLWRSDGATSMTAWLCARYAMAWGTAREWVRVASAFRSLPAIAGAYARGDLSWDQVRPLTKFATAETDERWAEKARRMRPGALEQEATRHQRITERMTKEWQRLRYLSLRWDEEAPLLRIEGLLAQDQGAALQAALERRAEEIVLGDEPLSPHQEARMADALVELACSGGDAEPAPPTLVVHADAAILTSEHPRKGPWLAETKGGPRLSSEGVRRLACDARIEWVLEHAGRTVGIGRRGRTVPGPMLRVLRHRDLTCRFPGCGRKQWLKAHHVAHWASGGPTDLDNLVLLCDAHHRLIHEGGWRLSGRTSGELRFHDPRGRAVFTRAP